MVKTLTVRSSDGIEVDAHDQGSGRTILVLHAARDDGSAWARVATRLASRFRVVRVRRRQHRLDLRPVLPCTIAAEVDDVQAIVRTVATPLLVVGHSSGGVVALESMLASPASFAGAVLYEPPVVVGPPLGGEALRSAQAAYAAGHVGTALTIFLRDVVRVRAPLPRVVGTITAAVPGRRAYVRPQLDDCAAVDDLGVRLPEYARVVVPTVLLGGRRSPAHFRARMDALGEAMPRAEKVILPRQGHHANILAPGRVAAVVAAHADRVFG